MSVLHVTSSVATAAATAAAATAATAAAAAAAGAINVSWRHRRFAFDLTRRILHGNSCFLLDSNLISGAGRIQAAAPAPATLSRDLPLAITAVAAATAATAATAAGAATAAAGVMVS